LDISNTGSSACFQSGTLKSTVYTLVLCDNAANMEKAIRDATIPSYGCFADIPACIVNDGSCNTLTPQIKEAAQATFHM